MKIAVLGLGGAGSVFAAGLARGGAEVSGYDPLVLPGADGGRAAGLLDAGVSVESSTADAVNGAGIVISLTGEEGALAAAESAAKSLGPRCIYLDMNLMSPIAKERIRELFSGADVVDGTIMKASVAAKKHLTPVYLAGERGLECADILCRYGLNASFVDETFGAACGIKLLRGIFMKSIEATLMESVHAAVCLGIQDSFLSEIRRTFRESPALLAMLHDMITTNPNHAVRHGGEVLESKALLDELGIDATMSAAIAAKYFYMGGLGIDEALGGKIPDDTDAVLSLLPVPDPSARV